MGYARPLEAPDLFRLQDHRGAAYIAGQINASFDRRLKEAEIYNARLASGELKLPGLKKFWWSFTRNGAEKEKKWREVDGRKKASLVLAMNDSVKWWFWSGGALKVIGDTAQVTSPLVVKVCSPHLPSCRELSFIQRLLLILLLNRIPATELVDLCPLLARASA